jgi:hypothetical protein
MAEDTQIFDYPAIGVGQPTETISTESSQAIRTGQESTPVPAPTAGDADQDAANQQIAAALTTGVGAREDSGRVTLSGQAAKVNAQQSTTNKIQPLPNVLDQYSSYTYTLSWFLLSPNVWQGTNQATGLSSYKTKLLTGAQLLVRSGGGGGNTTEGQAQNPLPITAGPNKLFSRSPEFDLDFYLDNLVLKSNLIGKGSGSIHNVSEGTFTVTEPLGITLIPRLYRAVQSISKAKSTQTNNSTAISYSAAIYGLLISFYGYDENGNLARVSSSTGSLNTGLSGGQIIDNSTIVEKFYPFKIRSIKFRVANKLTEYAVDFVGLPYAVAASQNRGTIPFPVALTGSTVQQVLVGRTGGTGTNPAIDGRPSSQVPDTGGGIADSVFADVF